MAALKKAVSLLAGLLMENGFDAEIVETHHHKKADAPSGTAKTLLAQLDPDNEYDHIYGRSGQVGARPAREIGIHAVRGGTVTGEHEVGFYGTGEEIILTHRAENRSLFARGALRAAAFLKDKPAGMYTMTHVVDEILR